MLALDHPAGVDDPQFNAGGAATVEAEGIARCQPKPEPPGVVTLTDADEVRSRAIGVPEFDAEPADARASAVVRQESANREGAGITHCDTRDVPATG
jgi:hypothetical protein